MPSETTARDTTNQHVIQECDKIISSSIQHADCFHSYRPDKWSKNVDESPHRMSCRYRWLNDPFRCVNRSWCCYCFFLLRYTQNWLAVLLNGPDNPQNCPFSCGISTPSNIWFPGPTWVSPQTQHLDRFSRFCRGHELSLTNVSNKQTDAQTDYATMYVGLVIARILCNDAMRPNNTAAASESLRMHEYSSSTQTSKYGSKPLIQANIQTCKVVFVSCNHCRPLKTKLFTGPAGLWNIYWQS